MRKLFFLFIAVLSISTICAQYVGIGTVAPVTQLTVIGTANNPSIPDATSSGILRIGVGDKEAIDIGKMPSFPFSGWIQSGFKGNRLDALSLQPMGGSVGIGTIAPQAALDITSTTQGFLPPRMTFAQRNTLLNPVEGLIIWCTDCATPGELEVFNGTTWTNMCGGVTGTGPTTICAYTWMTKNLDVSTYRNGDPIPQVTDPTEWAATTTGAWCWYNNDPSTGATYGKLYNWYAYNDPRGLAPIGWHVATDDEWDALKICLGTPISGGSCKEVGTTHWASPNTGATNISGFTALPGGSRSAAGGTFVSLGSVGKFWGSQSGSGNAHLYWMYFNDVIISRTVTGAKDGASVRCVKD